MHVVTPDGRLVNLNRFDKVKIADDDKLTGQLIAVRVGATVRPMEPLGRNSLVVLVDDVSLAENAMASIIEGLKAKEPVVYL